MKALSVVLAAAAATTLSLLAAAPVHAAGNAINPGDELYSISCDGSIPEFQLFDVEPATAQTIAIGTGSDLVPETGEPCAGQPAYDATSGVSYYVQRFNVDGDISALGIIDPVTGVSVLVDQFLWDNGEFSSFPIIDAIAIAPDGAAYALGDNFLWALNLDDATLEPIGEADFARAFAAHPVSGAFYYITPDGELWTIDVTTAIPTFTGDTLPVEEEGDVFSLQIDQGGLFWVDIYTLLEISPEVTTYLPALWSFSLGSADSAVFSDAFGWLAAGYYGHFTLAILIIPGEAPAVVPDPELAATGVSAAQALVLGVSAISLGLLGSVLLAGNRRSAS